MLTFRSRPLESNTEITGEIEQEDKQIELENHKSPNPSHKLGILRKGMGGRGEQPALPGFLANSNSSSFSTCAFVQYNI